MRLSYRHTKKACYLGMFVQAIVINLAPLLFVTFHESYAIPLRHIGLLVSINFGVQIVVDIIAAGTVDRFGYRRAVVLAQVLVATGLVLLGLLPPLLANPYAGLVLATSLLAAGGGLLEVVVSPILHALPTREKSSEMILLHSFYCWGHATVVLLSSLYFVLAGISAWQWLPLLWAIVPVMTGLLFLKVPMCPIVAEGETAMTFRALFARPLFWVFIFLMICAGAAEQPMAQWSSLFAEQGLGVNKAVGDLLGPCLFAILMGISRALYGVYGGRLPLRRSLALAGLICACGYILAATATTPALSLAGCAVCGLAVGILWPGMLSFAAIRFPLGGTALFGLLALGGDVGCSLGPGLVGWLSDWRAALPEGAPLRLFPTATPVEAGLKTGLLTASLFPALLCASLLLMYVRYRLRQRVGG
ncbi:MAG: MFS transporter [Lentisphaerae bacterium]|jgi:fucose permease|nr:MFS transporter [Lentisphaerota bacterium]